MEPNPSNEQSFENDPQPNEESSPGLSAQSKRHLLEASISAVSGGVAGALIGRAAGGKQAGIVGAVAGAVTGALIGDAVGDDLLALEQRAAEALGEAPEEDELPAHYSWKQLQALSKPQQNHA